MKANKLSPVFYIHRIVWAAAMLMFFITSMPARTWTSADGSKTFEGELKSYDPATGMVGVTLANGAAITFVQDKLSGTDITFLKDQGKMDARSAGSSATGKIDADPKNLFKRPDGKPADMSKPVQVFIFMGQSNMVGMGKIEGGEGSLENAVKVKNKYPYLVDDAGKWLARNDVRCAMVTCNEHSGWLEPGFGATNKIGIELGFGQIVGNAIDAPVLLLKACIGNRSLGWDLLPPGSEPYDGEPGYRGTKENLKGNGQKPATGWYAGKQYDDDTDNAKAALENLDKFYPGAKKYEVAGFVFWQAEKDHSNKNHMEHYEENLVRLIKALRKDFNAPNAKFVCATLGEAKKGSGDKAMEADLNVDGNSGKHPEFKGNVAAVYTHDMAQGGGGNSHYGGNAEVYMDVGEAMGKAMIELLKK